MMNVVLNFHKKDQKSAEIFLNLLMEVQEGIECRYYLQYGDDFETLTIKNTIDRFCRTKSAEIDNTLPSISIASSMIDDDPNLLDYPGLHTKRSKQQKNSILQWNLCVYKYIHKLDHFLIVEPDCIVLKNYWLFDIHNEFIRTDYPIFGHLKEGVLAGESIPTHWAGCSVYRSEPLRKLNLEKYFNERFENPWWKYRNQKETKSSNNCFWGPVFSGYDISYDYFLFALYWKEKTGSNDPKDWPVKEEIENKQKLIFCDFHSKRSVEEFENDFLNRLPLVHGVKSDDIRGHFFRHFQKENMNLHRKYPRGRPLNDSFTSISNDELVSITSLKDKYKGKRCFIIGNGPSLNKTDLKKLKHEYTFGLNRIYLNEENMEFTPTFYCVVNPNVIEQFSDEVDSLDTVKFIRSSSMPHLKNFWNTFLMDSAPGVGFIKDLESGKWHEGWTVTFCAIQVAYYLGFDTVILIGVDHFFQDSGKANLLVTAEDQDKNHFHPGYFGKGIKWQYPDLERSEQSYKIAKEVYELDGRKILDATIEGKLTIFPKVEYEKLFKSKDKLGLLQSRTLNKARSRLTYSSKRIYNKCLGKLKKSLNF